MIHTGDCVVSDDARRALRRASVRAARRGTNIVSQEDLFVALLQSPSFETERIVSRVPRLESLSAALTETEATLAQLDTAPLDVDVWASKPMQTSIELAAHDGNITAGDLIRGLLAVPRTHLLKLIATEYEMAEQDG